MPAGSDSARPSLGHRVVFPSQIALGAVGLVATSAAVVAAGESVHRSAHGAHHVAIAGLVLSYPALNAAAAALLALGAVGVAVISILVRSSWRQLQAHRGFVRGLAVIGPLDCHPGVLVVDDASPQAFCAGFLRPAVYISHGAVELLAAEELDAVLSHEQHHRETRDPLRFACARVLSQGLFFLPALRALGDRYCELAELNADGAAARASVGGARPLASALLAFDAAAPAGVAGISPERVDSLLGQTPRWRLPQPLVVASLAALCVLVVVVWRAGAAAAAHASFNLPVVSSQPCMLVLAMIPALALLAARVAQRRLA